MLAFKSTNGPHALIIRSVLCLAIIPVAASSSMLGSNPSAQVLMNEEVQEFADTTDSARDQFTELLSEIDGSSVMTLEDAIDLAQRGQEAFDQIFALTKENGPLDQAIRRAVASQQAGREEAISDESLTDIQKAELEKLYDDNLANINFITAEIMADVVTLRSFERAFYRESRFLGHKLRASEGAKIVANLEQISALLRNVISEINDGPEAPVS